MNLDELRAVQHKERSKDSLQHLRESYYADVGEYIQGLRDERDEIARDVDNPFDSEDISRLSDEIETAEGVAEAIYERRVGKIVKRASLAAAGMNVDEDGLTTEEKALFTDLVDRITENKSTVFDVLDGVSVPELDSEMPKSPLEPTETPEPPAGRESSPSVGETADVPEATAETDTEDESVELASDTSDVDRTTVRVTRDVGDILGVDDREYVLRSEDVVTLPETNAAPLIERDAAEPIE